MNISPTQYANNLSKSLAAEKLSQTDSSLGAVEKNSENLQRDTQASIEPLDTVTISDEARVKLQEKANKPDGADEETTGSPQEEEPGGVESHAKSKGLRSPQGADQTAIDQLKEMLEEAQKRLKEAQEKLAIALQKFAAAETEEEKLVAQTEVEMQSQMVAVSQSEVLVIQKQLQEALDEGSDAAGAAVDKGARGPGFATGAH